MTIITSIIYKKSALLTEKFNASISVKSADLLQSVVINIHLRLASRSNPCSANAVKRTNSKIIIKPKKLNYENATTKVDIIREINNINTKIAVDKVDLTNNGGVLLTINANEASKLKEFARDNLTDNYGFVN